MRRCAVVVGWTCLGIGLFAVGALAHGVGGADDERLNIGVVALSFALIVAFVYVAAQGKRGSGSDV